MDSTVFKYKHQYQQQHQHQHHFGSTSSSNNYNINSNNNNINNNSSNNNNQNSIFILNTATNNILPTNPKLYYSDLNDDNNVVSSSSASTSATTNAASTSVWSSASSTMCSPAAHAIQKLFNCSSNSFKANHGNCSGIESKQFKTKSELLKKKTKFWKYLEGEANDNNNQRGIEVANEEQKKLTGKSLKHKSKYWSKSYESDNQNHQDLSELLEYSCSLCDNCRCMDCQIGYFDCENSDDSNSEYSFHLSAYEEDEEAFNAPNSNENHQDHEEFSDHSRELKSSPFSYDNCCNEMDNKQQHLHSNSHINTKISPHCAVAYCVCNELNCSKLQCQCEQCFIESDEVAVDGEFNNCQEFATTPDH